MLANYLSPQAFGEMKRDKLKAEARQRQTPQSLTLLDWTLKYRVMLAPERRFVAHPHLRAIYADECREMVIYKAAQLGASEYLISWMLWAADMRNATGLYVFPTDTHVSDFSAARLGPAIEPAVSSYLAQIIVGGAAAEGSRGADRVGLKRVHNRFIYFRGAKVSPDGRAPQLRSIDADALVLDEFDEMDTRSPAIARKRLSASGFAQVRIASTPTYADMGIHAEYLASDQRQWHIPCLSCGKHHAPTLDDLVLEWDKLGRPVRWNQAADGSPFLKCPACGGALDRESGNGEWVALHPEREVHGYHLFRLSLPGHSLESLLANLDTLDETKRQQAFNQDLGLPYTPSDAQFITDAVLDKARREYALGEVSASGNNYAGIDVGRVLHIVIRGTAADGSRPLRFVGTVDSFDDASRLLKQFNVKICVVDALPETRAARSFQKEFPRYKVWLAFYADGGEATKKEQPGVWDQKELKVNIDRTRALDMMFAGLYAAANGNAQDRAEWNTLPANIRDVRDYYAHLKAPKRVLRKDASGAQVAVYLESGPDHYAHAENYCSMARKCPVGAGWAMGSGG